jgi:hypothetical protein
MYFLFLLVSDPVSMKNCHKSLYMKKEVSPRAMPPDPSIMGRKRKRNTSFVGKLTHAIVAN